MAKLAPSGVHVGLPAACRNARQQPQLGVKGKQPRVKRSAGRCLMLRLGEVFGCVLAHQAAGEGKPAGR